MAMGIVVAALLIAVFLAVFLLASASAAQAKRKAVQVDMDALMQDETLRESLDAGLKIKAIKRYRELSGSDLKSAKQQIEHWLANPDILQKKRIRDMSDAAGAGIRDKVMAGEIDEAIALYAGFMGVDKFTAEAAIERLQREMNLEDMAEDLRRLLRLGDKASAIESYQQATGADLAEALSAIEQLEARNDV